MCALSFLIYVVITYAINTELTANGAALPSTSTENFDHVDEISPSIEIVEESHKGMTWALVRELLHSIPATEADGTSGITDLSTQTLFGETSSQFDLSKLNGLSGDQLSDRNTVQPLEIQVSQDIEQIPDDLFDMIPKDRIFSDENHIQLSIDSNSLANQVNISNLHNSNRWDISVDDMAPEDEMNHSIPLSVELHESLMFPNESLKANESEFADSDFKVKTSSHTNESDVLINADSIEHIETDSELNTAVDSTSDSESLNDSVERRNDLQQVDSVEETKDLEKLTNELDQAGGIVDMSSNSTVKTHSVKVTEDSEMVTSFTEVSSESNGRPTSDSGLLTDSMEELKIEVAKNNEDIDDSEVLINDSEERMDSTEVANYSDTSTDSIDVKDSKLRTNFLNDSNDFEGQTVAVDRNHYRQSTEPVKVNIEALSVSASDQNHHPVSTDGVVKVSSESAVVTDSVEIANEEVRENSNFKEGNPSDIPVLTNLSVSQNITIEATTVSESLNPSQELNKSAHNSMNSVSSVSESTHNSDIVNGNIFSGNSSGSFKNGNALNVEENVVNEIFTPPEANFTNNNLITEIRNDTENSLAHECPSPGFCIFWFIAQDACSMDGDCQGSSICCPVGCAKTCVEV